MATSQFCSEHDKVWPEIHACWSEQNAIDKFLGTVGKILTAPTSKQRPLHIVTLYIMEKGRLFCSRKVY